MYVYSYKQITIVIHADNISVEKYKSIHTSLSSLGRYVFGSEISYNKAPPRLPGLGC